MTFCILVLCKVIRCLDECTNEFLSARKCSCSCQLSTCSIMGGKRQFHLHHDDESQGCLLNGHLGFLTYGSTCQTASSIWHLLEQLTHFMIVIIIFTKKIKSASHIKASPMLHCVFQRNARKCVHRSKIKQQHSFKCKYTMNVLKKFCRNQKDLGKEEKATC